MRREDAKIGQTVKIGRENGEKTLCKIIKLNGKTAKCETLEVRGRGRGSRVGAKWNCPYSLIELVDEKSALPEPVVVRTVSEIVEDINRVECDLSPENLCCDGELPMRAVRVRHRQLTKQLKDLTRELALAVN